MKGYIYDAQRGQDLYVSPYTVHGIKAETIAKLDAMSDSWRDESCADPGVAEYERDLLARLHDLWLEGRTISEI